MGAFAGQALGATGPLRAEIFRAIQRYQRAPAQPLKAGQPAAPAQHVDSGVKTRLQMAGIDRVEHRADGIVRRDFRHAKPGMAIGGHVKDSDCMKNSGNADSLMSTIE